MNPLALLFMALATFLLAVIAFAAAATIALVDPGVGGMLQTAVFAAGAIGVIAFGASFVASLTGRP